MIKWWCALLLLGCSLGGLATPSPLRIMSWQGYVTETDIRRINTLLQRQNYPYTAEIIEPLAENAEQIFSHLRRDHCDIAFVTLFFFKMEREQLRRVVQPIDTDSPRLTNYPFIIPGLDRIPMGMHDGKPLYIPWGGGSYGFYIDTHAVDPMDFPNSVTALWHPQWAGKYSINGAQEWYNVGLALMALGHSPYYLHQLVQRGQRDQAIALARSDGPLQRKLTALYRNSGHRWQSTSDAKAGLTIISSWGPEINQLNQAGGRWQRLHFREGNMYWLDSLAFHHKLRGRRLEAAEIVANYLIGQQVQMRITRNLSMKAASTLGYSVDEDYRWLRAIDRRFVVPPYDAAAQGIMNQLLRRVKMATGDSGRPDK